MTSSSNFYAPYAPRDFNLRAWRKHAQAVVVPAERRCLRWTQRRKRHFTQSERREADEKQGIITQAWSPISGIKRDGEKAKATGNVLDPLSHPSVVQLATKYGKSAAQIILRWQIQIGTCPIPKSVRPERIAENIDIFDFALAADEVQAISALDIGERGGPDPELVSPQTFPLTTHD